MAGSLNKVMLMGNLGKDPEIKFMPDGSKIALFSIATTEFWKDKTTGERRDRTEWHRIVVFNDRLADIIEKYVRKGSRVYIEGQLQTRKWTDQSGIEKYTTEIVLPRFRGELLLMDSKRSDFEDSGTPFSADIEEAPIDASSPDALLNDDIPF